MRYTLAITSCNRHDLLKRTLDSFIRHTDLLPTTTVILEDSDAPPPAWINAMPYCAVLGRLKWRTNGQRRGQIFSLDSLYAEVDTPYVFHLEDDWEFIRGGDFMRRSFITLERFPLVSAVSLRGADCNGHPLVSDFPCGLQQKPGWEGGWGGYSFNPGLRRMSDLKMFGGSFGRFVGYGRHGCGHELDISRRALDLGYRIAVLDTEPHVKHIGAGVSRAVQPLPPAPRVLLAVPVTRNYDYGRNTSGVTRETVGRIEACRDTWMKDAATFPNVDALFFYGGAGAAPSRLRSDERELFCPDDYTHLPEKIRAVCRYARDNNYDFLVKSDDDSLIYIDRLLRSGFDRVDQMGYYPCTHNHKCGCYVTGMCYTLSRRAFSAVADAPLLSPNACVWHWAEDFWTGHVLREAGIKPTGHPGWVPGWAGAPGEIHHYVRFPLPRNTVAAHSVRPDDMRKWYAEVR
jgi:hypothetical protein